MALLHLFATVSTGKIEIYTKTHNSEPDTFSTVAVAEWKFTKTQNIDNPWVLEIFKERCLGE